MFPSAEFDEERRPVLRTQQNRAARRMGRLEKGAVIQIALMLFVADFGGSAMLLAFPYRFVGSLLDDEVQNHQEDKRGRNKEYEVKGKIAEDFHCATSLQIADG